MPTLLIVRMTSLGDLVHTLPMVTEIHRAFPTTEIDWVAEESFAELPKLHPAVSRVIPVALRRWQKQLQLQSTRVEVAHFLRQLRQKRYSAILDVQGLLKSAVVSLAAHGPRYGFDAHSIREKWAFPFYNRTFRVPRQQHAIARNLALAAAALHFTPSPAIQYGLQNSFPISLRLPPTPFAVLLMNSTRVAKEWAKSHWHQIATQLIGRGITPVLVWGDPIQQTRAARLAQRLPGVHVAPKLSLREASMLLSQATLTVGVDTGLTHLSAALKTPTIALYSDTDPNLNGAIGDGFVRNLGSFGTPATVSEVWNALEEALA